MTPARLLAPVALVAAAVALFVVVTSGSGDSSSTSSASPTPTATATTTGKPKPKPTTSSGKTYTVKPGDTPSGIAAKLGVNVDDLLAANPDADPNALTVGSELKIP